MAFARKVKTFNLSSFLKTIRNVQEKRTIKIDPAKLRDFGGAMDG